MDKRKNLYKATLFATPVLEVLDFLLCHPESELTDTEIATRVSDAKKSAVNGALRKLAGIGLVTRTPRGNMVFNRLNDTALAGALKIVSNQLALAPLIEKIAPQCEKIVLFGSRSDGTHTADSDFDLFVVTVRPEAVGRIVRKDPNAEAIGLVTKTPEHMLSFSEDEPALQEETRKGIILWERK
jgi:predicted nucleotidyltransferase